MEYRGIPERARREQTPTRLADGPQPVAVLSREFAEQFAGIPDTPENEAAFRAWLERRGIKV